MPYKVEPGQIYGRLEVIAVLSGRMTGDYVRCVCRCECGEICMPHSGNVLRGVTRSCGCYAKEVTTSRNTKHDSVDADDTTRCCVVCREIQPIANFVHKSNHPRSHGRSRRCVSCDRDVYISKKYNVTPQWYEDTLAEQGGRCSICQTDNPDVNGKNKYFCVDHCHKTGKARGLLCSLCNSGIGFLGDSIETVDRAKSYLESYL